jgi:cell division protein FtsZ
MTEGFGGYGYGMDRTVAEEEREMENNLTGVAKIKVIGVGGAGNNAVNRLIESGLRGAELIAVNTDNQTLARSKAGKRIQIGVKLTKGLGAGADPNVGRAAAEENKDAIQNALQNTDLLFITAGMGGGTGTGAAPVVAKIAKELKILTVAVVTLPFRFEAKHKMDNALHGVEELKKHVDSIIIVPNDKISEVIPKGTPFVEALQVADDILRQGIRGITEIIVDHALINLDFADVRTILKGRGLAHMGIGVAKGEKRIYDAVRCAVCSPLLNTTIEGASALIMNVIGGRDLAYEEVYEAADLVKDVADYSANIIFGACIDDSMGDEVEVVIIATGFYGGNQSFVPEEDNANSYRRAAELSERLHRAPIGNTPSEPARPSYGYPPERTAPMTPPYDGGRATYTAPTGYPAPGAEGYPAPTGTGDFVPEVVPPKKETPEEPVKRRRPGWVDYFLKKEDK